MKNKYLLTVPFLLFLFLTPHFATAQVSVGLKSGINLATTKDLVAFPLKRVGWYAGGLATIPICHNFFFQPELLLSSKGYRAKDFADGDVVAFRLNYINTPILIGYKIDTKTRLLAGAELGYLIKAINYAYGSAESFTSRFPHKFDVGFALGADYGINQTIGIEIRYVYGLSHLHIADAAGNQHGNNGASNQVFQVGLDFLIF